MAWTRLLTVVALLAVLAVLAVLALPFVPAWDVAGALQDRRTLRPDRHVQLL